MSKICILPTLSEYDYRTWGGVLRLVEALYRYAPGFGGSQGRWYTTDNPDEADIVHTLGMKEHHKSKMYTCLGFWENVTVPEYPNAQRKIEELALAAEVFTVLSQWSKEFFDNKLSTDALVIPNGVDYIAMQKIQPLAYAFRADFIWAKAGIYFPNCDYGSRPVMDLAEDMPQHRFVLTYAPSGDMRIPNNNIRFTARLPYGTMLRTLAGCQVYVSTVKETFGTQTIEAMAMGKPVLAYDFGGNSEILTHKVDGYLITPGESLLEGAEYILEHYECMSQEATATAMKYDWKSVIVPQYVDLWEQVL